MKCPYEPSLPQLTKWCRRARVSMKIAQFGSGGSNPMKCQLSGVQMGWSWSLDQPYSKHASNEHLVKAGEHLRRLVSHIVWFQQLSGVQMGWSWSLDNPVQNMLQNMLQTCTWDVLWVISYEFWKVIFFWAAITREGLGTNSTFGAPCPCECGSRLV